jgi:hypothetical protein
MDMAVRRNGVRGTIDTIRRNHALEHATITLMLADKGPMRVIGRAATDGFFVYADVETDRLRDYADEALARMQKGESGLAVTPLCGTNIAVAGVMAGVGAFAAASSRPGQPAGLFRAITAGMLAALAAQPVGRLVQKHYTTLADMEGVSIVSVNPVRGKLHKVRTAGA